MDMVEMVMLMGKVGIEEEEEVGGGGWGGGWRFMRREC